MVKTMVKTLFIMSRICLSNDHGGILGRSIASVMQLQAMNTSMMKSNQACSVRLWDHRRNLIKKADEKRIVLHEHWLVYYILYIEQFSTLNKLGVTQKLHFQFEFSKPRERKSIASVLTHIHLRYFIGNYKYLGNRGLHFI